MINDKFELMKFLSAIREAKFPMPFNIFYDPVRIEASAHWKGDSEPPEDHVMRLGPLEESLAGFFLTILRRVEAVKDEDWGYALRVPTLNPKLGEMTYKEYGRTEFWLRRGGLPAFREFFRFLRLRQVTSRCGDYLMQEGKYPLSEDEVRERWERVYKEIEKDKMAYFRIMASLRMHSHFIIDAMLQPMEDKEELTFPDKMTFLRRVGERLGIKPEDGLLEALGWDSVFTLYL